MAKKLSDELKKKFMEEITPIAEKQRIDLYKNSRVENQFKLLEQLGFIIVKFPSKDKKLSGFSIKKGKRNCIYINSNVSRGRQHFSLWHEYYHLIADDGIGVSYSDGEKYSESECRAHLFSSIFLMPKKDIEQYLKHNKIKLPYLNYAEMIKMAYYFKVSVSALLYRLIDLYSECSDFNKRFGIVNNYVKLSEKAKEKGLSSEYLKYEEITNDCYISESFFEKIQKNYEAGRVSNDRLEFIKKLLERAQENCND